MNHLTTTLIVIFFVTIYIYILKIWSLLKKKNWFHHRSRKIGW